jgi:hypothetical protein
MENDRYIFGANWHFYCFLTHRKMYCIAPHICHLQGHYLALDKKHNFFTIEV